MGSRIAIMREASADDLRNWVHCFNAEGVEGLRDRSGGHPVRRLTVEQEARVRAVVLSLLTPIRTVWYAGDAWMCRPISQQRSRLTSTKARLAHCCAALS